MNEKEMKKKEEVANEFADNVISKLPNDKETAEKVSMVLDIAKMFSEAKERRHNMEEQNITTKQLNKEGAEFIHESLKGIKGNSYKGIINAPAAMREIVDVIDKYDLSFNQARRLLMDTADFLGGCKMMKKKKTVSDNQKQFENGEITLNKFRENNGLSPINEGDVKLQLIDKE